MTNHIQKYHIIVGGPRFRAIFCLCHPLPLSSIARGSVGHAVGLTFSEKRPRAPFPNSSPETKRPRLDRVVLHGLAQDRQKVAIVPGELRKEIVISFMTI
jgi:hypothetical protein